MNGLLHGDFDRRGLVKLIAASAPAAFADMAREIDALTFKPLNGGKAMTREESLFANYTD